VFFFGVKLIASDTCLGCEKGMSAVQSFSAAHLRPQPRNCRTDQSQDLSPCLTPLTLATATAHAPGKPHPPPSKIHPL